MPYLKMIAGESYHLMAGADHPEVRWTKNDPLPKVELSAKAIRRMGLLEQMVPRLGVRGDIVATGPRFRLFETWPEDGGLDDAERLARMADEEEGEESAPKTAAAKPKGRKAAPPSSVDNDPSKVD